MRVKMKEYRMKDKELLRKEDQKEGGGGAGCQRAGSHYNLHNTVTRHTGI